MARIEDSGRSGPEPEHDVATADQQISKTPETREMLQRAALLGPAFTVRELCLVTDRTVTELLPSVRSAVAAGTLADRGGTRLGFSDDAVRRALRRDVPPAVASALHRDLAERLTREDAPAAIVAEHLLEGPVGVSDVGWVASVARRVQPAQPDTAVALLERLVESIDRRDAAWSLAVTLLAETLLATGSPADAVVAAEHALDRGAGPGTLGRLRRVVSVGRLWQARWRPARAGAVTFGAAADAFPAERAEQLAVAASAAVLEGRAGVAAHLAEQAERAARTAGADTTVRQLQALRGHVAHREGDLTRAVQTLGEATRSRRPDPHSAPAVAARVVLALVLGDADRFRDAHAEADAALAEARTWGFAPGAALAQLVQVRLHVDAGALARAAGTLALATDPARGGSALLVPLLDAERVLVALHREGLRGAPDWPAVLGDDPPATAALLGLGRRATARALAHRLASNPARAHDELREAWAACARARLAPDLVRLGPETADAARRTGDSALAREVTDTLTVLAARNPRVAGFTAAAAAAAALATGRPDAVLDAVEAWRGSPRLLQSASVLELLGTALRGAPGHGAPALEVLDQAADRYREAGAEHTAQRLHATVHGEAAQVPEQSRPEQVRTSWEGLTRTERIVAAYVEQGATNAEIARRLVVSRRTVETHVSHILAKLELRSRTELILAAAQRDRPPGLPRSRTPSE